MYYTLSGGRRAGAACLCGALLLLYVSTAVADRKPLTKEEQAKIDQAIDKGVAFLKKAQTKEGDWQWKMYKDSFLVGQCALPAYALLEAGVPVDDPVIKKAAEYLRRIALQTDYTYELALAILFFDRLGDPKDKKMIEALALCLIAGQHRTGGWSYHCPPMNGKTVQDLQKCLEEMNSEMKAQNQARDRALRKVKVPPPLRALTIFQGSEALPWREPPYNAEAIRDEKRGVALDGTTDNSNTQFAMLGLWTASRHGIPTRPTFEIMVERFERTQNSQTGLWPYWFDGELSSASRRSMICVGLLGLAIGRGLSLSTPGSPGRGEKDTYLFKGLAALSRHIGNPEGDMSKRQQYPDLYFLWSLERVGMLYDLDTIGGKDWYRWGAECLVTNQSKRGWWPEPPPPRPLYGKEANYGVTLNTSFALLFLKRSHPMKDLTAKLPFTPKELEEGISRVRRGDKFPVRPVTTPSPSKGDGP